MKPHLDRGIAASGVTGLYSSWKHMLYRCEKPTDRAFKNYGAKGVTVCPEWHDFATFAAWARANGWAEGLTIERRSNGGDYEPSNCTWATRLAQNQNQRKTHRLPDGSAGVQLARDSGVPPGTFRTRIAAGWPAEIAATAPRGARLKSLLAGKVYLR